MQDPGREAKALCSQAPLQNAILYLFAFQHFAIGGETQG
jgi:hypothetical protein